MNTEPIHKRQYHAFLSHSSRDKADIVEEMFAWFNKIANIPVWYDRNALAAGANFTSFLAESIVKCRAMIIVLSNASVASGWVEEEWGLALDHQKKFREFKIIPIVIDDCKVPGFLATRTHYKVVEKTLDIKFYDAILRALYGDNIELQYDKTRDIYVSRTWRNTEADIADTISRRFIRAGFRLIGDAEDHPRFSNSEDRVGRIISSTGGLLAILPYRASDEQNGFTSKYMLRELGIAKQFGLPHVIFAETGVVIPDDLVQSALQVVQARDSLEMTLDAVVIPSVEALRDSWKHGHLRHYVFFASNFDQPERNEIISQSIQRITAMRCLMGEDIQVAAHSVQQEIVEQIRGAFVVIGDITEPSNINTLIEIGVARGASIPFYLVAAEPRQRPAFMLRDNQVFFYKNDMELLGQIHRLIYPYRRRILNNEL